MTIPDSIVYFKSSIDLNAPPNPHYRGCMVSTPILFAQAIFLWAFVSRDFCLWDIYIAMYFHHESFSQNIWKVQVLKAKAKVVELMD